MCLITVAHQRGSGKFVRFTAAEHGGDEEEEDGLRQDGIGGSGSSSGSRGLSQPVQTGEVVGAAAMPCFPLVSAPTHMVSSGLGQAHTEWAQRSGFPLMSGFVHASPPPLYSSTSGPLFGSAPSPASGSGSGSWIGHKRGREDDESRSGSGASSQLLQDVTTLHRNIGDFRVPSHSHSQGQSSSSSGANIGSFSPNIPCTVPSFYLNKNNTMY